MFQVLILVCSINVAPADCQTNSALEVIRGPETANEFTCAFQSQIYVAATSPAERRTGEYMKTMCTRTSIGKVVG